MSDQFDFMCTHRLDRRGNRSRTAGIVASGNMVAINVNINSGGIGDRPVNGCAVTEMTAAGIGIEAVDLRNDTRLTIRSAGRSIAIDTDADPDDLTESGTLRRTHLPIGSARSD